MDQEGQLAGLTRAGLLRLPRTAEAAALAAELMVYERRVSAAGKDTYGRKQDGAVTVR